MAVLKSTMNRALIEQLNRVVQHDVCPLLERSGLISALLCWIAG
jgi:hypothetical protein